MALATLRVAGEAMGDTNSWASAQKENMVGDKKARRRDTLKDLRDVLSLRALGLDEWPEEE